MIASGRKKLLKLCDVIYGRSKDLKGFYWQDLLVVPISLMKFVTHRPGVFLLDNLQQISNLRVKKW